MTESRNGLKASDSSPDAARNRSIAAIVPAYNEESEIADVVERTRQFVDTVFVIDDASTDDTESAAREVADGVVSHPRNMGVGATVHTGYQAAIREGHDVVIQIDGDGQHDPSHIPELLETMEREDADMVIGSRWLNESHKQYSITRRSGIKFFTAEANIIGGLDITDITSGFRAYRIELLDDLGRPEDDHWALEQTLEAAKKGYDVSEVSVPMPPETDGSQFDIRTFIKYPPKMIFVTLKVLLFR